MLVCLVTKLVHTDDILTMHTYLYTGHYWDMVDRLQVNQLFTVPSAIRHLMKVGDELVTKYNLSTLKTIASSEDTYFEWSPLIPCKPELYKLMHKHNNGLTSPPKDAKENLLLNI